MHQRTGKRVPLWNDSIPHGAPVMVYPRESRDSEKETVVYFPSCVSRVMGNADGDGTADTRKVFIGLLERAGYNVVHLTTDTLVANVRMLLEEPELAPAHACALQLLELTKTPIIYYKHH